MKNVIPFLVVLFLIAGMTAYGCGDRSLGTSHHPIINGTPVEDEQSGHVLIYYHNLGRSRCSGTLLTPDWVLTAAHCFYMRETGNHDWLLMKATVIDPNSVEVIMGNQSIIASEIVLHPLGFPHVDLALIRLESPFEMPSEEYEPHFINPIYAGTKESVVGTVVSCHGYGCSTPDDDEGNCEGFGYLRHAWLKVIELYPSSDVLPYGHYHLEKNELEQLQWRGDSGSSCSLVLHLEDQTELRFLIGVTSGVGQQMTGLVPITDPDARDWILRTIFSNSFDTYVWPKPLPRSYHKEVDWRPCDGECHNWTSEYILTSGAQARFVSNDPYYSKYVWGPDETEIHPGYDTYTGIHPTCGRLDIEVEAGEDWGTYGIIGLRALCSGRHCHRNECLTAPVPLENDFSAPYRNFHPCLSGTFKYEVEYDLEEGFDMMNVDCTFEVGPDGVFIWDCPRELTGNRKYTGYSDEHWMINRINTDSSVQSVGLKSLRAECEGWVQNANGETVWYPQPEVPCEESNQFPSCDHDDGKFLSLTGLAIASYDYSTITMFIGVPADASEFSVEIFDGDQEPPFDSVKFAGPTSCFRLTPDPTRQGQTSDSVAEQDDKYFTNNDFTTLYSGPVHDEARAPSGNYFYRLEAILGCEYPSPTHFVINGFKVRSTGQISMTYGDFSFRASDSEGPYAATDPWSSGEIDTDFDGRFDFFVDIPQNTSHITFKDADADYIHDEDYPGSAIGQNDLILYVVHDPIGKRIFTNKDPSGNYDSLDGQLEIEENIVHVNSNGGIYHWRWENVWTENAVHVWIPEGSPMTFEVFTAPVQPLEVTDARSKGYWKNHPSDVAQFLPILLGKTSDAGEPIGSSVVVDDVQKARDIFVGTHGRLDRGTRAIEHLLMQLLAAKLNVKAESTKGASLESAYVRGYSDLSVGDVISSADNSVASVSDPSSLGNPEIVELIEIAELLDIINNRGIVYLPPSGTITRGFGPSKMRNTSSIMPLPNLENGDIRD